MKIIGILYAALTLVNSYSVTHAATLPNKPLVHGHRGSRGTHPENTIPSFQEAVDAGADVLELDMQLTKDDVVVISHEPEITGALCRDKSGQPVAEPIAIRKLTAKQLEEFDCGNVYHPRFPKQTLIPGTKIPTLDAFLTWKAKQAPALEINIETKMTAHDPKNVADPELFTKQVIATLKRHNAIPKTILQSFDFRTLKVAQKLEPSLRISALFDEKEQNICARTKELGASIVSPHFSLLSPKSVAECHAAKIQVVPWTLNKEEEWVVARALGVGAIITDYPRALISFLKLHAKGM